MNSCRLLLENLRKFSPVLGSAFLVFCLSLICGGCAYQLGPTNGELTGARSVQVNAFANKTLEPRLGEIVATSVRKQIQRDGTYRLNTKGDGDIIVTGTIVNFQRLGISFVPTDVIVPRDYLVVMAAQVIARERATGKVLFDRKVTGRTTVQVGSDLSSAERQAGPLLAEDLARNVTSLLVDGTW